MNGEAKFLHDLRAPLARARTYAKLLAEEANDESGLLPALLQALEDLEARIRLAEEDLSSGA